MSVLVIGVSITALITSVLLLVRELLNARRAKRYASSALDASRDLLEISESLKAALDVKYQPEHTGSPAIEPVRRHSGIGDVPVSFFVHDKVSDLLAEEDLSPKPLVWKYSNWQFEASERHEEVFRALQVLSNLQGAVSAEELIRLHRSLDIESPGVEGLYSSSSEYVMHKYSRPKSAHEAVVEKRVLRERRQAKDSGRAFGQRSSYV
ncbi:hypothetical protein [Brevibacterium sp. ZH18]|uniref:hypothetical protein n=1 Tax=Brevibacterium sp. ZH18 TaxID=2927784 RepID=UPI001F60EFF9|nr:hypothetical protein [Brevibacterium sp. ZH18]MCI4012360.1 hypothetical protein [Brevibacterium sp. ZH18]